MHDGCDIIMFSKLELFCCNLHVEFFTGRKLRKRHLPETKKKKKRRKSELQTEMTWFECSDQMARLS